MKRIALAVAVLSILFTVTQPAGEADRSVSVSRGTPLHLAIVIDSSGSMTRSDPEDLRKTAAAFIVGRLGDDDRATVVDFDHAARVLADATSDRKLLQKAIDAIDSDGGTVIGSGLDAAFMSLSREPEEEIVRGVILLSDGQSAGEHRDQEVRFGEEGWPIYTVGLGQHADKAFLIRIAQRSGGEFYAARTAGDLEGIFGLVSAFFRGERPLRLVRDEVKREEEKRYPFHVAYDTDHIFAHAVWKGGRPEMLLADPSGYEHSLDEGGRNSASIEIEGPLAGEWAVVVTGEPDLGEKARSAFRILVAGPGGEKIDVRGLDALGTAGKRWSFSAKLPEGDLNTGTARITLPSGKTVDVEGTADGEGGLAFDFTEVKGAGDYEVEIMLTGQTYTGDDVTRTVVKSVHVPKKQQRKPSR